LGSPGGVVDLTHLVAVDARIEIGQVHFLERAPHGEDVTLDAAGRGRDRPDGPLGAEVVVGYAAAPILSSRRHPSMRRALGLTFTVLLALTLLAGPASAEGAVDAADTGLVLAVDEEPVGPEPMDRLEEDNPARELAGFESREGIFVDAAAYLLAFAGLVGLALLAGLYYLLVHRPSRDPDGSA